ncbi:MAG: redoxin domain-containing protein [Prevotella sp.]|jgi:hypothetical protein|nr:redoxin domain-containing protein [Prevotella sp.]
MKFPAKLLLFTLCFPWNISAQQIEFSFPALPEKKIHVYYPLGNRRDSLLVTSDKQGVGKVWLPEGYMGFIRIYIPGSGSIECIGGEPLLKIEGSETFIDKEHVSFPGSRENNFLYSMFKEKELNLNRYAWIQFGMELYDPKSTIYRLLEKENKENKRQMLSVAGRIKESGLYASGLLDIMEYVNDIGTAIDVGDTVSLGRMKAYFHRQMDWKTLYTSGRLWQLVNIYYARLYGKEALYAENIMPLFGQLPEPMRSAFLETAFETCEKSGWDTAKDSIVSYIYEHKITLDAQNSNLRRILSSGKTGRGKPAPPIKGLADGNSGGITLVLFYESGCDHCVVQLEELKKHYAMLHNSGVRVVSVSADMDERVYEYHSRSFPWNNKICDYKGFSGENFINYAIIGTPTILVIGNGIIAGRYSNLSETGLYQDQ